MFIPYLSRNFDDTPTRVKKKITILDETWYNSKKREFTKLCGEGEEYYIVDYTPEGFNEYFEQLDDYEKSTTSCDFTQGVDISEFCFRSEFSINSTNGEEVGRQIIELIFQIIDEAGINHDYDALTSLLSDVKSWLDDAVNEMTIRLKNDEYSNILRHSLSNIKWKIDYTFNDTLQLLILTKRIATSRNDTVVKVIPQIPIVKSYKWLGQPNDIYGFYKKVKHVLISPDNTFADFKDIFSGKDTRLINPIKWHDNNASELLYFIIKLGAACLIKNEKRLDYEKLKACFVKSDGKIFKANFKNLKKSLQTKLTQSKKELIDSIVELYR